MPINVTIADDENLIRNLFVSELSQYEDIQISGQAANGLELIQQLLNTTPDVILLDLNMPGLDGFGVLSYIKTKGVAVKTIVVSMIEEEDIIMKAYSEGAAGFLCKKEDCAAMYWAIKVVAAGNYYFTNRFAHLLLSGAGGGKKPDQGWTSSWGSFTEKELEVIKYLHLGLNSSEIAEKIFRSTSTVNRMRQELMHRVGAKNTNALIALCAEQGLL